MNDRDFRIWLIGFLEGKKSLNAADIKLINEKGTYVLNPEVIYYQPVFIPSSTPAWMQPPPWLQPTITCSTTQ